MKVVVLYHTASEGALEVETYAREYSRLQPGNKLELVSLETPAGANMAQLYAINNYPAILAMSNDGSLLRLWEGMPLPLMSELTAYSSQ